MNDKANMWQRLRKSRPTDKQSGLSIDESRVAYASVQRNGNGAIRLAISAIDRVASEDEWMQRLANEAGVSAGSVARLTSVLPAGSYQLLLVEVPNVPSDEVNSAIRWKIKDLLDFPVDDAVLEVCPMPEQSSAGHESMAYAVATRRGTIQAHIDLLQRAGVALDVIDIPELCTRNIATLLPQDAAGVAFLYFAEDHGVLTITRQGLLYLIRRIDIGRNALESRPAGDLTLVDPVSTIVLELQRSLDYYESHFDRRPMTNLVLAPGSDVGGLAESLKEQLGLKVDILDFNSLFELCTDARPEQQGDCLLAVGAALRSVPLAA